MNRDPRFLRSRLRHRLLPALERAVDRNIRATVARTARNVREDAAYLDALASEAALTIADVDEAELRLRAAALSALARPLGARVVRQSLRLAAAAGGEWDADVETAHIDGVLDLASGRPGRSIDLPGALSAQRDREYVRISRPSPGVATRPRRRRASGRQAG